MKILKFIFYFLLYKISISQYYPGGYSYTEHYIQKEDGSVVRADQQSNQSSNLQSQTSPVIEDQIKKPKRRKRKRRKAKQSRKLPFGLGESDKDKNVPQTYPYLGISYKIKNPPYDTVTLVPYIEADNEGGMLGGLMGGGAKEVKSNVIFTGKKRII